MGYLGQQMGLGIAMALFAVCSLLLSTSILIKTPEIRNLHWLINLIFMQNIKKLLHFVKPYWRRSLVALIFLVAVVLMDLAIPRLIERIIDKGINGNNMQVVISTTIIMLVISLFQTLFAIANNLFSVQVGEGVARDLREALFLKVQAFSFGNLDHLNTGQLMVRLSSDTTAFQRMVQVSLRIGTRAPMLMIGSLILMFVTDARLALMIVPVLLATIILIIFFVTRMGPLFMTVQRKLDRLNTVLQENIAGVRLVKAFVRADHEGERFAAANEDYTNRNIHVMRFMAVLSPAMSIFVNIGIVLVIWVGGIQAAVGSVTVGQIVAFINYLQMTLGPLGIMVMLANVVAAATASSERINEVMDTLPEVQDGANPQPLPDGRGIRVAFEGVDFHYNGTNDGAGAERCRSGRRAGPDGRHPRRDGRRQVFHCQPGAALLRCRLRQNYLEWRGHPGCATK